MTTRTRAALALGLLTAVATPTLAQPPIPKDKFTTPDFTAFPDLKVPLDQNGALDHEQLTARLTAGFPRTAAADAPAVVKVRTAQANAGLAYIQRVVIVIQSGRWDPNEFDSFLRTVADTYAAAADLEATPAGKQKCLEDRVFVLKFVEWFTTTRVGAGLDPRQRVDQARLARLGAEAELLKLMDAQKAGAKK